MPLSSDINVHKNSGSFKFDCLLNERLQAVGCQTCLTYLCSVNSKEMK